MNSISFQIFIISLCIACYEQYFLDPNHPQIQPEPHVNPYDEYNPPAHYIDEQYYIPETHYPFIENDDLPQTGQFPQDPQIYYPNNQYPLEHYPNFPVPLPPGNWENIKNTQNHFPILDQIKQQTIEDPGLDSIGMPRDGKNHPCYRDCKAGHKMTCYYRFHVEWYHSMSKACMDCPFNATHCGNPDCVPANGIGRAITVVNRKMPGPSIEVCQGDTVVVDVENSLLASGTTIHWHGMHQKETPYMDGTPFVTQCPIQPESTFRYEFTTTQSGTYFWHSHIGLQRGDGTTGALIIRDPQQNNPHRRLYDVDNSEHVLLITDWINNATINIFTDHHHSSGDNRPGSILINGRGRFRIMDGQRTTTMKAPVFEVEQGKRYRFRMINGEFLNCPVELSVDGHNITVIASDGSDLLPITASALVSYAGERFDFIINADKKVDTYWIRVRGLLACAAPDYAIRQVAVLRYKGAKADEPPVLNWNINRTGLVLNAVQEGEEQSASIPVSRMRSLRADDATSKQVPDHKFFISYDMRLKNNTHFHRLPYYGTDKVNDTFWVYTPQLNHISMKLPKSPLLVSRPSSEGFCNQSTTNVSCQKDYCQCPHVLNVKLNSVVEIIIIDEGATFDTNHPFHLHGYSFRVVGQRRLGRSTTTDAVKALDRDGKIHRNLHKAPVKDTVTIPDGGYTVIRFVADNPGYWLFHCHIEFHAEIGMALVFKVGEHENMKPVPQGFPQCGDYKATDYTFIKNTQHLIP